MWIKARETTPDDNREVAIIFNEHPRFEPYVTKARFHDGDWYVGGGTVSRRLSAGIVLAWADLPDIKQLLL